QAWQWLAALDKPRGAANHPWGRPDWIDGLGRSAWYMGAEWSRGAERVPGMLDGLAVTAARSVAEASFILNIGPQPIVQGLADYESDLVAGAARGIPMLCCNPDRVVMVGDRMAVCAGMLAERYLALGGVVHWVGKPDPQIYATVLAKLGDPDPARVLCVGDGLHTDIAGAHAAGLDAALVPGSVHGGALGIGPGELPAAARLAALCAAESQWPRWVLAGLRP
ncbi:MAG: TIGR01459 family HAD-type hydrolase, partial [Alphaproteobacteria bacterium]|nr:TIGR01459 family HAD-type hydrolase [Alphaproteobacteria bacterium]